MSSSDLAARFFYRGPDPFCAFHWKLEVSGLTFGHFFEVTGLEVNTEVVKYREGGRNENECHLMGQTTYSNIVLKHGLTDNSTLSDWKAKVDSMFGRMSARRDGSILLLDVGQSELARWNFKRGWPCKWQGPTLTGFNTLITIETLEIAHEGLERVL
jgi:phage tail-like protein